MKLIVLLVLFVSTLWKLFLNLLDLRSAKNPIPVNVSDVYDEETYVKWRAYNKDKTRHNMIVSVLMFVLSALLIVFDAYAIFDSERIFRAAILVTIFDVVVSLPISIPAGWRETMEIEEKYGFNKSTTQTFISDSIKNLVVELILGIMITCLYAAVHLWLGDKMLILFAAILMLLVLIVGFLAPFFLKIFNKFTPLEDGELREKLSALLEKNGYQVREIKVMDASKRTTKSNAAFTGFGKTKTIILYDNLVNNFTPEEICAVFAHEMGHGLHKDTLKSQIVSFFQIIVLALLAWLMVRNPEMYKSFGFEQVNYGFAAILMGTFMGLVTPLFGLISNALSRRAEYRADKQAVSEGYGEELIGVLKKLSRSNFSNLAPMRLSVALEYSHPTTSQRIAAIEKEMNK